MRTATLLAAIIVLSASAANAIPISHQRLVSADPAVGASLLTGPRTISIMFSEPVHLVASITVAVRDPNGAGVATGPIVLDPANNHHVTVALPPSLAPGTYRVTWSAVSPDTRPVQGAYTFTVG